VKTPPESRKVESWDLIRTIDWQRDLDHGIQVADPRGSEVWGNGGALSTDSPKHGIPTRV
jgi:hypothetical protein